MVKKKWYVVWKGRQPGIYDVWADCKKQTESFDNALYKSFESFEEANCAYNSDAWKYTSKNKGINSLVNKDINKIIHHSLSVDAACSGNPGQMEYRGVYTKTGEEIFRAGPYEQGTNNIGEFLALVHGLALLKKQNSPLPIYSDSVNAMAWIRNKKCKTRLEPVEVNRPVFELIERAERWLENNTYTTLILKWETKKWGEIPADFGRK